MNKNKNVFVIAGIMAIFLSSFPLGAVFAQQSPQDIIIDRVPNASLNWAGYAVTGGDFTAVGGTWTVPIISDEEIEGSISADAAWVGIGGLSTDDLIQSGVLTLVDGSGNVFYRAFYELLPETITPMSVEVSGGDSVTVSVTKESSSDEWVISFSNNTSGENQQVRVNYESSLSSAEWIQEMPMTGDGFLIPLSQFGTVNFTDGFVVKDGRTLNLSESDAKPIEMITSQGQTVAVPSSIGFGGHSFNVTRSSIPVLSILLDNLYFRFEF